MVEYSIDSLLKKGIELLGEGDYFNPLLDAQILLSHLLGVDRIYLYTHRDKRVGKDTTEEFIRLIQLRKNRYPLQYITNTQEFMGLDFLVKEGVLIPRPDTEILIESIIDIVGSGYFNGKVPLKIVDIGTGSGAVTLSLLHFIKDAFAYSVDISETALEVARENSIRLGLSDRVEFLKGDVFSPLRDKGLKDGVDILVSNPPYIRTDVIDGLQVEVSRYEPRLALDGGEDGLDFYRTIIDESFYYLSEKSIIAFEIGFDQGIGVRTLLEDTGLFKCVRVITDLSGHDRVVIGEKG